MTSAATPSNETAPPFADELRLAMEAFKQNPANLKPFIACTGRLKKLRKEFTQQTNADCDSPLPMQALRKSISVIHSLYENLAALDAAPYDAETHKQLQSRIDEGIGDITGILTELQEIPRQANKFRAVFNTFAQDGRAFIDAAQHVTAAAGTLPPSLQDLGRTVADMGQHLSRAQELIETQDEQRQQIDQFAASTAAAVAKMGMIKGASADYIRRLEEALASCSEGVPAPVTVRKPLSLRKTSSAA